MLFQGIFPGKMLEWVPFPGNLPDPGIKLAPPVLAGGFFAAELLGKPTLDRTVQCGTQSPIYRMRGLDSAHQTAALTHITGRGNPYLHLWKFTS